MYAAKMEAGWREGRRLRMAPKTETKVKWFARLGDEGGNLVVEFFPHWPEPGCWGIVLADVAHHVAESYSQRSGTFDPRPILRKILHVMSAEIKNPKTQRTCLAVRARSADKKPLNRGGR